jgi:hypothetical protein
MTSVQGWIMSCEFLKTTLALYAEGDLLDKEQEITASHLEGCDDCRRFLDQLRTRQLLLKSLRRQTVSPAECAGMRRGVMSAIRNQREQSGWALRIERVIVLGVRRQSYAVAVSALLGIASVSVFAHMRHPAAVATPATAVFEDQELRRPDGYRDWILIGGSAATHSKAAGTVPAPAHRVYINPSGYREYARTGNFPEGTEMVWESVGEAVGKPIGHATQAFVGTHGGSAVLLASVKDSTRFDGGWGFFDFSGAGGAMRSTAQALPESSGCRTCHRQDAETDNVFTQFYPGLRSAAQGETRAPAAGRTGNPDRWALSRPRPVIRPAGRSSTSC